MKKRTVFDTNIWISYIINAKFYELASMHTENEVIFLCSLPAIAELKEVLSRKKFEKYHFNIEEIIDLYTDITEFCNTIAQFKACVDPDDNFLFDLAIQGNADYLVSGDKQVRNTIIKNGNYSGTPKQLELAKAIKAAYTSCPFLIVVSTIERILAYRSAPLTKTDLITASQVV